MTTVPFTSKPSAIGVVAGLVRDPHAPLSAMIEIADRCNEVCVHCYQVQGQKGEMTTDQLRSVIDELAELGVLFLTLSGGEPTLRPDFLDVVRHARARKFAVKIYTNGLTMTPALARSLAELAVQEVQISLYSHRASVHDWVTRVPGSFERTVAGVRALRDVGVAVVLKTPLMRVNQDEHAAWVDFVTGLGADYLLDAHLDPREDGDRTPEALRIDDAAYLRFARDPSVSPPLTPAPAERDLDASLCGACSGTVHIEANGELRPCTQLGVPVGNALSEGVATAWRENTSGRAIRAITWRDVHGCRDCDLQPYCSRCFANARVDGGDALGPYTNACHKARLHYELVTGVAPSITAGSAVTRDVDVGPYRELAPGRFETREDVCTEADEALARAHGWIRPDAARAPRPSRVERGDLVQIRRPGKIPRPERVPPADL